tara:strand:- start:2442 stop:2714 length:273 start_codon:yes stop_codon:yes gene_type:complete
MKKLTKDELANLQNLQKDFNTAKLELGNTVLQQSKIMESIEIIKSKFGEKEKELMDKYGKDVTINLETGEISEKEEESKEAPELKKVETK